MYKSNAFTFRILDVFYYVRAKAEPALLPNIGQVNFPEWLEEQAEIAKQLEDENLSEMKKRQLDKKLIFPGMLGEYIESSTQSSLFEYRESEDDFQLSPQDIELQNADLLQQNEAKDAEIAALKQRLAELETAKT